MKTFPWLGLDFIAAGGRRVTSFQLCILRNPDHTGHITAGDLLAVACVDLSDGGDVEREMYSPGFRPRRDAIIRLARRTQSKAKPATTNHITP